MSTAKILMKIIRQNVPSAMVSYEEETNLIHVSFDTRTYAKLVVSDLTECYIIRFDKVENGIVWLAIDLDLEV